MHITSPRNIIYHISIPSYHITHLHLIPPCPLSDDTVRHILIIHIVPYNNFIVHCGFSFKQMVYQLYPSLYFVLFLNHNMARGASVGPPGVRVGSSPVHFGHSAQWAIPWRGGVHARTRSMPKADWEWRPCAWWSTRKRYANRIWQKGQIFPFTPKR